MKVNVKVNKCRDEPTRINIIPAFKFVITTRVCCMPRSRTKAILAISSPWRGWSRLRINFYFPLPPWSAQQHEIRIQNTRDARKQLLFPVDVSASSKEYKCIDDNASNELLSGRVLQHCLRWFEILMLSFRRCLTPDCCWWMLVCV